MGEIKINQTKGNFTKRNENEITKIEKKARNGKFMWCFYKM